MCHSAEHVIKAFRELSSKKQLLLDIYLDEDPTAAADRFWRSEEFAVVRRWAARYGCPAGKLLDLGAGPGVTSYAWSKAGYGVVALEPETSEIVGLGAATTIANKTGVRISRCRGIAERLPFHGGSFDIVYARQVLHHASDLREACRNAFDALRSRGLFIVSREHVITKPRDLEPFLKEHPLHRFTRSENAYPRREYLAAMTGAGFRIARVFGPHDTVVNHFPMSEADFEVRFQTAVARRVGRRTGLLLTRSSVIEWIYRKLLSWSDETPGRLYSFLAIKP